MNDRDLLEPVLSDGAITAYFKHCAMENLDPRKPRHQGFNIVTAVLMAAVDPDTKAGLMESLLQGFRGLTPRILAQLLDEEAVPPGFLRSTHLLVHCAEYWDPMDFALIWQILRNHGYQPAPALHDRIEELLFAKRRQTRQSGLPAPDSHPDPESDEDNDD